MLISGTVVLLCVVVMRGGIVVLCGENVVCCGIVLLLMVLYCCEIGNSASFCVLDTVQQLPSSKIWLCTKSCFYVVSNVFCL